MFDETSRYAGLPSRTRTGADGRTVTYVARRLVPPPETYQAAGGATVTDSDRLDLIAHRAMGTPAGFWQIADANRAVHPSDLTATPGRRLVLPMPRATGRGGGA